MGRIENNSLLAGIHGSTGNLVIVHDHGRVWTRSKPSVAPKATPRRKVHRKKIGEAARWASNLPEQAPEVAARYEAAAQGTQWSWQNLAIADYMHGPVIEEIDPSAYTGLSGERIMIQARDDVPPPMRLGVVEVRVVLRNLAGVTLEEGAAEPGRRPLGVRDPAGNATGPDCEDRRAGQRPARLS